MNEKVSVIIPVYKSEKYLEECISSVFGQDYSNLEIILVDDGSPDKCPVMCDRFAEKYANIQVIHQANQGPGPARNAGMEIAKGAYLLFIDSDDCLDDHTAVSRLVEKAEEKRADIVVGNFRRIHGTTISGINEHHLREGSYTKTADFRFKGFYMHGHLAYCWGKLYRKSFLEENDLKLRPYPFTQDKAYNIACYVCDPVYAFIDESVVLYRVNGESITFKYKEDFVPVWISIAEDFQRFIQERGLPDGFGDLIALHIFFGLFFGVKQEIEQSGHDFRAIVKVMRTYGDDPFAMKNMRSLARGEYIAEIEPLIWKIVVRVVSALFYLRAYHILALGIEMLLRLKIDKSITKSRYRKNGG